MCVCVCISACICEWLKFLPWQGWEGITLCNTEGNSVAVTYCDEVWMLRPPRSVEEQLKVEHDFGRSLTTCNSVFTLWATLSKGHPLLIVCNVKHSELSEQTTHVCFTSVVIWNRLANEWKHSANLAPNVTDGSDHFWCLVLYTLLFFSFTQAATSGAET